MKKEDIVPERKQDLIDITTKHMQDRVRMMNPNQYGPHLPETTPEEDQYYKDLVGAVAGSVNTPVFNFKKIAELLGKAAPEAKAAVPKLFGDTTKTAIAREAADVTADMAQNNLANMTDVARSQQALSREVDMQQRRAAQLEALKAKGRKAGLLK